MHKRQILIKVKEENYFKLLVSLGLRKEEDDSIKEITLSLPDTKDIYKLLSTSDLVEDWDFDSIQVEKPIDEISDIKQYLIGRFTDSPNSHIILSIIKGLLTIKKENPTITLAKNLFEVSLINSFIEKSVTREDIALETFIDGYNSMSQDVIGDFLIGLSKVWNFIDPMTLNLQKFVQKIYGVGRL